MINEKVIIAGFGGQGVMTMGQLLSYIATDKGINTLWFPSYGPETRGGTANCSVTISEEPVRSPVISKPDSVIIMNKPSLAKFQPKLKKDGHLLINSSLVVGEPLRDDVNVIAVPANDIALELGNLRVSNMVMLGAYIAVSNTFSLDDILNMMKKKFTGKKAEMLSINKLALERGMEAAKK